MTTRIDLCPDEDLFVRLEQGSLSEDERAALMTHIDACPTCAELLVMLTSLDGPQPEFHSEELLPKPDTTLKIGRYEVIEQAGVGGVGVVYKTRDTRLDRLVAVKLLRPDLLATHPDQVTDATQRLQREARTLASLDHPHIVTIYDVDTHHDQLFTACAFIDGGNLRQWLSQSSRHWTQVVEMGLQIARALAAAHAVGIVHRDVKPENVLVHEDRDHALLTDFGMATLPMNTSSAQLSMGELATQQGTILGTPAYMSPEQLDGQSATASSDQFSFCVMLYEAVYGFRPYHATDYQELLRILKLGQLDRPHSDTVPDALFEILHRGLRPRPTERHADMHALVDALDALLAPPVKTTSRKLAIGIFAAVALCGALLALALTSQSTPHTEPETEPEEVAQLQPEPTSRPPVDTSPEPPADPPTPPQEQPPTPTIIPQQAEEQPPIVVASLEPAPPKKRTVTRTPRSKPPTSSPKKPAVAAPTPPAPGTTPPPDLARVVVDTYEDRRAFQMAVYAYDGKACKKHFDRVVAALPEWEFAKADNLDNLRCQYLQGDCSVAKKFAPLLSTGLVPMDARQIQRHNLMYAPKSCLKSAEDKILANAHHIIMDCPTHKAPSAKCSRRARRFRELIDKNPDHPVLEERDVKSALYFIKDVPE